MTATTDDTKQFGHCDEHGDFEIILFEHPICPMCKEARKVAERDARQAKWDEERAAAQEQRRLQNIERLKAQAEIPRRFSAKGFDAYQPATPSQQAALSACQGYVENIDANIDAGRCLVLTGPKGVGKSHLLSAALMAICEKGIATRYSTMIEFLASVKGNWAWHGDDEVIGEFTDVLVLVLDEVWIPGHERDREAIFALIDARYRDCLPTLIATNLSWDMMREHLGERFIDRLCEAGGLILPVLGQSMRSAT